MVLELKTFLQLELQEKIQYLYLCKLKHKQNDSDLLPFWSEVGRGRGELKKRKNGSAWD